MQERHVAGRQTRWVVGDFSSAGPARHAADVLQTRGYQAYASTPSLSGEAVADEGFAVVRIDVGAWIGLLIGVTVGFVLGTLLWNGQIAFAPLAPALSAGRTAVPVLFAGILGAVGWLFGALLPLARERPVVDAVVRLPAASKDVAIVARQLIDLGAQRVRVLPAI